jgi:signal peptidase I
VSNRRRLLWFGVAGAVLIGWLAIAPLKFGGSATYVVVRGTSMLPTISNGDAVMLRQAPQYNIGDIVAFRSQSADAVLLHRIVDVDGPGFVLRGDNNQMDDLDRPTSAEILGRQVRLFPGAALWVERLASPVTIAVTALVTAALFVAFGSRPVGRARRNAWWQAGVSSRDMVK